MEEGEFQVEHSEVGPPSEHSSKLDGNEELESNSQFIEPSALPNSPAFPVEEDKKVNENTTEGHLKEDAINFEKLNARFNELQEYKKVFCLRLRDSQEMNNLLVEQIQNDIPSKAADQIKKQYKISGQIEKLKAALVKKQKELEDTLTSYKEKKKILEEKKIEIKIFINARKYRDDYLNEIKEQNEFEIKKIREKNDEEVDWLHRTNKELYDKINENKQTLETLLENIANNMEEIKEILSIPIKTEVETLEKEIPGLNEQIDGLKNEISLNEKKLEEVERKVEKEEVLKKSEMAETFVEKTLFADIDNIHSEISKALEENHNLLEKLSHISGINEMNKWQKEQYILQKNALIEKGKEIEALQTREFNEIERKKIIIKTMKENIKCKIENLREDIKQQENSHIISSEVQDFHSLDQSQKYTFSDLQEISNIIMQKKQSLQTTLSTNKILEQKMSLFSVCHQEELLRLEKEKQELNRTLEDLKAKEKELTISEQKVQEQEEIQQAIIKKNEAQYAQQMRLFLCGVILGLIFLIFLAFLYH